MNWINTLVVLLFITTIIGGLVSVIWKGFSKILLTKCPNVLYLILKISLLFYIVPVFLLIISFDKNYPYIIKCGMFDLISYGVTPVILILVAAIIILWSVCNFFLVFINIPQIKAWRIMKKQCYLVRDKDVLRLFEEIKSELGIKKRIILKCNDYISSPMMHGIFRPTVVLANLDYWKGNDRGLRLVLYHELMHYKYRDINVKFFSGFITVLHSYNIFAHMNSAHINTWSEFQCDLHVCEYKNGEVFDIKEYYNIIIDYLSLLIEKKDANRKTNRRFALADSENSVMRRMGIMIDSKKTKTVSKMGVAAIAMAFVILSSSVSLATGYQATKAYANLYTSTVIIESDDVNVIGTVDDLEDMEYEIAPEDDDCVVVIMQEAVIGLRSTIVTFNWTINAGVRAQSISYKKSAGDTIMISCTSLPGDAPYWIGIIEPDGTVRYSAGSGAKAHTFSLDQTGYYSSFVQNRSSVTINSVGSYTK